MARQDARDASPLPGCGRHSKYLLEHGGRRLLVDCGLFQGLKQLRLRNRDAFAVPAAGIDAGVLTHAHIDHSGYLPALARQGFRGPVFCTGATRDLCTLLLPDSGHLQEEDAFYANQRGFSRHQPPCRSTPRKTGDGRCACSSRGTSARPSSLCPGCRSAFRWPATSSAPPACT